MTETIPTVTKEQVLALLETKPMAVVRGIEAIYAYQTADEQSEEQTKHHNGVGFNGQDANLLSSFAHQIAVWREDKLAGDRVYPLPLSPRQMAVARKKIVKYAGQLARIANDKIEAETQAKAERDAMMAESGTPWQPDDEFYHSMAESDHLDSHCDDEDEDEDEYIEFDA